MGEIIQFFNKFIRINEMPDTRHADTRRIVLGCQMTDVLLDARYQTRRCQTYCFGMPDLFLDARYQTRRYQTYCFGMPDDRRIIRCQIPDTQTCSERSRTMPDVLFWDAGLIFRCQIPDTQIPDVLFWDTRCQINISTHKQINS